MVGKCKENEILKSNHRSKKEDGAYEILSDIIGLMQQDLQIQLHSLNIVKENLMDKEAYTYVIETNLMQRSFSDLLLGRKALVLKVRYEKITSQGSRNDLQKEINNLDQGIEKGRQAEDKTDSRKAARKKISSFRSIRCKIFKIKWIVWFLETRCVDNEK